MKNIFTNHPNQTENPQTYFEHGFFAFKNSLILIYGGILGIIHAICPWWFPFRTSTIIIKIFKHLVDSRRHINELNIILSDDYLLKRHLKK